MQKLLLGILYVGVNALLVGMLAWDGAALHPALTIACAAIFNLVVGVRLGYNAADAYVRDVIRLNRFLADQNESLAMSNRELLERFAPGAPDPAEEEAHQAGSPT